MYEAFDSFLATDTWHTPHPFDRTRFYKALHGVVGDPEFNPDQMAEYMRSRVNNSALEPAIEDLRTLAWGVQEYLIAVDEP